MACAKSLVKDFWHFNLLCFFTLDCQVRPNHGADCLPRAQYMWIPNQRVKTTDILHHREGRAGQQDQRLLPAVRGPLQWDELAEEAQRWVSASRCYGIVWFCRSCVLGFDGECVDLPVGAELVGFRILSLSEHQDDPGTLGACKWAPASGRCWKGFLPAAFDLIRLESSQKDLKCSYFDRIKGMENRQACCSQDGTFEPTWELVDQPTCSEDAGLPPFIGQFGLLDPRVIL